MLRQRGIYVMLLISSFFLYILSACNNRNSATTEPSDDPTLSSLTFQAQDSFPGLAKAVFVIEDRLDTGLIYNDDSLIYGTRVDSVVPRFIFNHTPASAILMTPFDTTPITGYDTANFSMNPSYLYVLSESEKVTKWYKILVTVHQSDPDLFVWNRLTEEIYPPIAAEQKALWHKGAISLFVNDGIELRLYQSADGAQWSQQSISGLPADCHVKSIIKGDDRLYYASGKKVYFSDDGKSWSSDELETDDYEFVNMMLFFNDSVWAIVSKADTLQLAVSKNGNDFYVREDLPDNFPVSDFAAVDFVSKTYRNHSMLVGGYNKSGDALNSRWAVEFSPGRGYRWTNLTIEQPSFSQLTGASVIWYNKRLYMFGGATDSYNIGEYDMLESLDEGMTWNVPDSSHNCLPDTYRSRIGQSVVLDDKGYIYIIGGRSRTEIFTDVYRGKLNSIDWD